MDCPECRQKAQLIVTKVGAKPYWWCNKCKKRFDSNVPAVIEDKENKVMISNISFDYGSVAHVKATVWIDGKKN